MRTAIACILAALPALATPNIVMILSDDQGWGDYGFMGHPHLQTPHLDRLAAEGAVFTRGYVPGSLCRCSLATLITGLYPHQHGITSNDPPPGVERHQMLHLIQAAQTLPGLLAPRGYRSFQSGKWWEGNYRLGGFTEGMTCGAPECGGRHGDKGLAIGREGLGPIEQFLDAAPGQPFFLWYAPFLPHEPHDAPERLVARYRAEGRPEALARYWAMCTWFDETIGQLLAALEARGLRENTLIVYAADNGWIQNAEGKGFAPRSKRSPYDGGLRTPILLHWPGHVPVHRDDTTPVLSLDLAPTILNQCGVNVPAAMPGIDLLPLAHGQPTPRPRIFGEVFTHDAVDIARPERSLLYRWAIEGDWKLILPKDPAQNPELYRITQDPHEETDLAPAEPARVQALTAALDAWWAPAGD